MKVETGQKSLNDMGVINAMTLENVVKVEVDAESTTSKQRKHLMEIGFKPGQSGNPAGRPKGSRNKLSEDFTDALYQDFRQHGVKAIADTREKDPATYVKVIASLLPKEVELKRPLEGLSDDELMAAMATLQAMMAGVTIEGEAVKTISAD